MGKILQWTFLLFIAGVLFQYGWDFAGWFIVIGFIIDMILAMHPNGREKEKKFYNNISKWLKKKLNITTEKK